MRAIRRKRPASPADGVGHIGRRGQLRCNLHALVERPTVAGLPIEGIARAKGASAAAADRRKNDEVSGPSIRPRIVSPEATQW